MERPWVTGGGAGKSCSDERTAEVAVVVGRAGAVVGVPPVEFDDGRRLILMAMALGRE